MKKLISILLVAMLLLSMFPATAMPAKAATYEAATSIAEGDVVLLVCSTKKMELSAISTTSTKYGIGVAYTSTPAGVAPLTVEAGSATGSFAFKMADGKYLNWSSGNSLTTSTTKNNNSSWTVKFSGENATIANVATSGRKLQWNASSPRFACYTSSQTAVQLYKQPSTDDSECTTHPNAYEMDDGYEAGCTTTGKTNSIYCPDCDTTITPQQDIAVLGHNWVGDSCQRCGTPKPDGLLPVTQLTDGEYVIVATTKSKGSYALPSTIASKMDGHEVTIEGDALLAEEGLPYWTVTVTDDGITLRNTSGKYLGYGSSTNFASKDTAYTWAAAASGNGFALTASGRALAFQANDGSNDQLRYGAYSTNQTNGEYVFALTFYAEAKAVPAEPVVNGYVDGQWKEFTSMDDALTAANGQLQLIANTDGITYDGALHLDLNGFNATNVSATKVYAYDSKATTSSTEFATLTTTSEVVVDNTVGGVRYIALNNSGTYTFHVLDVKVTAISLRTTAAGVYYKAQIVCDEQLAAATQSYGMLLSTYNMPGADFMNDGTDVNGYTVTQGNPVSGEVFTSGSVFGIFKDTLSSDINRQRGEIEIYANAYLKLNDANGGKILVADTTTGDKSDDEGFDGIAWSLQRVLKTLNDATTLTAEQQTRIRDFYDTWGVAEFGWNLNNIATWTPSSAA